MPETWRPSIPTQSSSPWLRCSSCFFGTQIRPSFRNDSDIKVNFEDGTLTVTGERTFERKDERNYHRIERSYGTFTRTFSLPRTVDANAITANYRNGILEIEIPKKEEAKPKQIAINVGTKQIDA
jgi:hypothetical protein